MAQATPAAQAAWEARTFILEAVRTVPWPQFQSDLNTMRRDGSLTANLDGRLNTFLTHALPYCMQGIELRPEDYVMMAEILEAVADARCGKLNDDE